MLTTDDLASFEGQTITKAEDRDGCLRLHLASGFILAIEAKGDELDVRDESSIP